MNKELIKKFVCEFIDKHDIASCEAKNEAMIKPNCNKWTEYFETGKICLNIVAYKNIQEGD